MVLQWKDSIPQEESEKMIIYLPISLSSAQIFYFSHIASNASVGSNNLSSQAFNLNQIIN